MVRKTRKRGGQMSMNIRYPSFIVKNSSISTVDATAEEPTTTLPRVPLATLIMHDPNSSQPSWLHWLVTNIPNGDIRKGSIIIPYNGPSPPPNTGTHNYNFELYKQVSPIEVNPLERNHFSPSLFASKYKLTLLKGRSFKVNT